MNTARNFGFRENIEEERVMTMCCDFIEQIDRDGIEGARAIFRKVRSDRGAVGALIMALRDHGMHREADATCDFLARTPA